MSGASASIFAAIILGVLSLAGLVWTGAQSRKSASRATSVDQMRAAIEAYAEARKTSEAHRREMREQIEEHANRITVLEREKDQQRRRMQALIEYVKALRSLLRLHNIDNVPPPPPDVYLEESA